MGWGDSYFPSNGVPSLVCGGALQGTLVGSQWTWEQKAIVIGEPLNPKNCVFAVAPLSASTVYAAAQEGLHYYNGSTWSDRTPDALGLNKRINDVFYAYSTVCVATNLGVFYCTLGANCTPDLASWNQILLPAPALTGRPVNAIYGSTDPTVSPTLYAAYKDGDLYKIVNNCVTVTPLIGTHAGYPMDTVAIVPGSNDDSIYVGTMCQGGLYRGTLSGTPPRWSWTQQRYPPGNDYDIFHYWMRVAPHPTNANRLAGTDGDGVYSLDLEQSPYWQFRFDSSQIEAGPTRHLHGLAVAPLNPSTLFVGTGHSGIGWGTHSHGTLQNRMYRGSNWCMGSSAWKDITDIPPSGGMSFPQPLANTCCHNGEPGCDPPNSFGFPGACFTQRTPSATEVHCGCTSLISSAVDPTNSNLIFVATFGSEQENAPSAYGRGMGVVRGVGTNVGMPTERWDWQQLNRGLCSDDGVCNPNSAPPVGSLSLFVGTVVVTPERWVYIATLNGIYERFADDPPTMAWTDISANLPKRRFQGLAADCASNVLYAGTSEPLAANSGDPPPAEIWKGTFEASGWSWGRTSLEMQNHAWESDIDKQTGALLKRYRVFDIQVGSSKAYATVLGSAIYRLTSLTCPGGGRTSVPRRGR